MTFCIPGSAKASPHPKRGITGPHRVSEPHIPDLRGTAVAGVSTDASATLERGARPLRPFTISKHDQGGQMEVKRAAVPAIAVITLAGSALTGCSTKPTEDDTGSQVDVLGSMLASESELNTILVTSDLHPQTALRQPARLDADEHAPRPVCLAVIGNAMDEVYRDSGFRQFRESLFADEGDDLEVDQAVTAFDTPTAARTLVSRTVDTWRQCAGDSLKISYDGNRRPSTYVLGNPSVVDDMDVPT